MSTSRITGKTTCDYAACTEPATSSAGGWDFCPTHAASDPKERLGSQAPPADDPPVTPPSPIGLLLEQASAHSNASIRRLGDRIETLLDRLRTDIAAHAQTEQQRIEDEKAKAAAWAEVRRLEEQLRAAKEAVGRSKAPAAAKTKKNITPEGREKMRQNGLRLAAQRAAAKAEQVAS